MIIKAEDRKPSARQNPCGGEGTIYGLGSVCAENPIPDTRISMAAQMTLAPGASVGLHTHEKDEELYYIVSGHGSYIKNSGEKKDIGPGDVTLTRTGERHSILADKNEPVVFFAVIVK